MLDAASLFAAFVYGLAGSLHCVAMCGPLCIVASSPSRRRASLPIVADEHAVLHDSGQAPAVSYQLARIAGYAALGAIFGALGHQLDLSLNVSVSKLLPFLLVTLLVAQAMDLKPRFAPNLSIARLARFRPKGPIPFALFVGGITALIPCGFLYSTLPLAISAGTPAHGAALLAAFALGTAPALVAATFVGQRLTAIRRPLLLAAAGFVVFRVAFLPPAGVPPSAQAMHCHEQP